MRIVMTGGTSGIGRVAAGKLLDVGHTLLIGTRNPAHADAGLASRADIAPLDLAGLASTRRFADAAAEPVDVLLLNAGLQATKPSRSTDGFELTFAANHLAHFFLIERLLGRMAPNGRVILTSSGTHDPAERTAMPPPRTADPELLAFPERSPARDRSGGTASRRAYSSSKLCNVMTARELARRTAADRPDLMVAAFDPGYVPATGLARDYPAPVRFLARHIIARTMAADRVSTPEVSGGHLAALALDPAYGASRGAYFSVRAGVAVEIAPSELARDPAACARLWEGSEGLLGLATERLAA